MNTHGINTNRNVVRKRFATTKTGCRREIKMVISIVTPELDRGVEVDQKLKDHCPPKLVEHSTGLVSRLRAPL